MSQPSRPDLRRVALITYGCAKNLVDSEVMAGRLLESGFALAGDPARAEAVLLNTCGFIRAAREEALEGIAEAVALKAGKPGLRIAVVGCFPERSRDALSARFPEVDVWAGVRDFDNVVSLLRGKRFRAGRRAFLYSDRSPRALSTPPGWAYLKISEGCSGRCAFCAIPGIKGGYRSRSSASIVQEARGLADKGVKEINLVSQDSTFFGRDRGREDGLARLLDDLARVDGLSWIRVLYGCPEGVTDKLLEAMGNPKICPYFDLPFQHADRAVLRRMGRATDARRGLHLLEKIRSRVPEASVRTSLIVGFPGEGEREFEALRDFVRKARFDHLGVFAYSPEEGTRAYGLGDPVPAAVKEERRKAILDLQAGISSSLLRRFVGRMIDVLIEGRSPERPRTWLGRSRWQAPEVDGLVFVRASAGRLENRIRRVRITSSGTYDLEGRLT
ncbi:MAG: 30S ribosomal protein S12 methylthiotransferase RimO [Candidatus Aminicenantes bacterium]|nr:30S ribosomal protein S12 methylthiotransferase RimO [Candidatus Aminicenantes bacterium]